MPLRVSATTREIKGIFFVMEVKEIWKDVPGYEGLYQASNLGNVRSMNYNHSGKIKKMKLSTDGAGYLNVSLCKKGKKRTYTVHSIIAVTFLNHSRGQRNLVVDHIDNNRKNNKLENIQIVSPRVNVIKDTDRGLSRYPGVSWNSQSGKWISKVYINGRRKYLGIFQNEIDAHLRCEQELKKYEKNNRRKHTE